MSKGLCATECLCASAQIKGHCTKVEQKHITCITSRARLSMAVFSISRYPFCLFIYPPSKPNTSMPAMMRVISRAGLSTAVFSISCYPFRLFYLSAVTGSPMISANLLKLYSSSVTPALPKDWSQNSSVTKGGVSCVQNLTLKVKVLNAHRDIFTQALMEAIHRWRQSIGLPLIRWYFWTLGSQISKMLSVKKPPLHFGPWYIATFFCIGLIKVLKYGQWLKRKGSQQSPLAIVRKCHCRNG